jgi:hypothetical protein
MLMNIYDTHIANLKDNFKIIISYSLCDYDCNDMILNKNIDVIKVPNKCGYIGAKLCTLEYMKNENINYNYLLFLNLKEDKHFISTNILPFIKSLERIEIIKILLKYKDVCGIFPNNIQYFEEKNYNEIFNLKQDYGIFSEGNCFACNKEIIHDVFKLNYKLWYDILNYDNMKMFEKIWIMSIIKLNKKYLVLDKCNIFEKYNIKLNAIYFPQFHEIPENNKFWGNNFTEWSLLKNYEDEITIDNKTKLINQHRKLYSIFISFSFQRSLKLQLCFF